MRAGVKNASVRHGACKSSTASSRAAKASAGSSLQTTRPAQNPEAANAAGVGREDTAGRCQGGSSKGKTGTSANTTQKVATVWLLNVMRNGVTSVAKPAAATT